jgi:hypothetical protein
MTSARQLDLSGAAGDEYPPRHGPVPTRGGARQETRSAPPPYGVRRAQRRS